MGTYTISLPASLDLEGSLRLTGELAKLPDADQYIVDCSRVRFVEPFGMLMTASELQRVRTRAPNASISAVKHEHLRYPAHMGFFRAFGVAHGKGPGEAKGNESYLPITLVQCSELESAAAESGVPIQDAIEQRAKQLSEILARSGDGHLFETLTYSLRELMRNVVEHANASDILLSAQFWPSKKRVEVAILDCGIGLRQSLSANPHIDASDDKKAINYALMPAVSGKAFKGAKRRLKGVWANSGFGLYMTNRIARNGGTFFVASGETGMLLTAKNKKYYECAFGGTAIRMVIKTDQLTKLRDALANYRAEGYEIQRTYQEIVNIDPSSASLMLSEDFDLPLWQRLLARLKGRSSP